jgi:hypothetical protein
MPKYDYHCPSNDRIVEIRHAMSAKLSTWGEVCLAAGVEPGDTPADAPVERLVGMAQPMASGKGLPDMPSGGGCCGGVCGGH